MDGPLARQPFVAAPDTTCVASTTPAPGLGLLPVNAYLIEGREPVLVDTGVPALADATMAALAERIDLASLAYVWLTHADADHVGALERVLEAAPRARLVTNYLGMGKLSMRMAIPPTRFYLINPGQSLALADRSLRAIALPSYDAPETMGLFDSRSRALFSADCFGALLHEHAEDAAAIDPGARRAGLVTWTSVDAPWLSHVRDETFAASAREMASLAPDVVLSAHLPPARGMLPALLEDLRAARTAAPFVGPDQAALEAMLGAAA